MTHPATDTRGSARHAATPTCHRRSEERPLWRWLRQPRWSAASKPATVTARARRQRARRWRQDAHRSGRSDKQATRACRQETATRRCVGQEAATDRRQGARHGGCMADHCRHPRQPGSAAGGTSRGRAVVEHPTMKQGAHSADTAMNSVVDVARWDSATTKGDSYLQVLSATHRR